MARIEYVLACYSHPPPRPGRTGGVHGREALPSFGHARDLIPAAPGSDRKENSAYVRHGTYSIFGWVDPLAERRRAVAKQRHTRVYPAHEEVTSSASITPTPNSRCR